MSVCIHWAVEWVYSSAVTECGSSRLSNLTRCRLFRCRIFTHTFQPTNRNSLYITSPLLNTRHNNKSRHFPSTSRTGATYGSCSVHTFSTIQALPSIRSKKSGLNSYRGFPQQLNVISSLITRQSQQPSSKEQRHDGAAKEGLAQGMLLL